MSRSHRSSIVSGLRDCCVCDSINTETGNRTEKFHRIILFALIPLTLAACSAVDGIILGTGYSVTYNANGATGGDVPVDGQLYQTGVAAIVLENTGGLSRTGFTFHGWNTAANGGGIDYATGSTISIASTDITLFAKWVSDDGGTSPSTFAITYDSNGATGGTTPADQAKAQGTDLVLATNAGSLVRSGFTFDGWNTAADGSGTSYAEGATYSTDADLALYAKWGPAPPDGASLFLDDTYFAFNELIATGDTPVFGMGSTTGDADESPVHSVTLTRPVSMNKYEVTNSHVAAVFNEAIDRGLATASAATVQNAPGDQQELLDLDSVDAQISWNGSELVVDAGFDDHPAIEITWYGAAAVAHFLNVFEGRGQTYDLSDWSMDATQAGYRLPTEAEWEYAARGGIAATDTTYAGSNAVGGVAWYTDNSSTTQTVGTKNANEIGLHDMSGNVWEWVNDWYGNTYYSSSPGTNPDGPGSGTGRVYRGGSASSADADARVANRTDGPPTYAHNNLGFRLVGPVAVTQVYDIGDSGPAGGVVFYDKGSYSDGWRYLEADRNDISIGVTYTFVWSPTFTNITTNTGIGTGKENTEAIVAAHGVGSNYAAYLAETHVSGDFSDWFLPSRDELSEVFARRADIGSFVPVPQVDRGHLYWTSSQDTASAAWMIYFEDAFETAGSVADSNKNNPSVVRPIRRF